jgi:hypothetical protein
MLSRVENLIRERTRSKTKEEQVAQLKLKAIGRCPMNFEWLRMEGGWRCAGGSHTVTEAEMNKFNI